MGKHGSSRSTPAKTKVLIVDDHPIVREGIIRLVARQHDMRVSGEAEDAAGALKAMRADEPDVAVVDLSLKESSGLDLIKGIGKRHPNVKILVLSMFDASVYAERSLRAGARGYLMKGEGADKLIEAIRKIASGEVYVDSETSQEILTRMAGVSRGPDHASVSALTDREIEILALLGQGLGAKEIAEKLHRSAKTVDTHRENIKEKLHLGSARELLRFAIKWAQSERM